jgi:4-diphosphocytidyl-2-C-methyl-D-erythritol kinase
VTTRLSSRAPAKINLTLHILGRRADGYHELESLVAFAGVADFLHFDGDAPLSLVLSGPTAQEAGSGPDNLVLRAARHFADRVEGARLGAFRLEKRLPVAAGIGGGSSDAAAALRLLARHNGIAPDDSRVMEAARATGADVPVCLDPRARMMRGIGERIGAPLDLPKLFAVLVNPRVPVETRMVFSALGLAPGTRFDGAPHPYDCDVAIRQGRNDLQPPARSRVAAVGDVLDALAMLPGARVARMSGSGGTCFALFDSCHAAAAAARGLREAHPDWWIRPTLLR